MKKVIMGVVTTVVMASSHSVLADAAGDFAAGCFACHSPATAIAVGAPAVGDKDAWATRIAKGGMEALYRVAIEGSVAVYGDKGNPVMMPKGGTGFSDDQLKAVVDYMVAQSK